MKSDNLISDTQKTSLYTFLDDFSSKFPIEWDRLTISSSQIEDENLIFFSIFGWIPAIKRDDFIVLYLYNNPIIDNEFYIERFITSSKEYSLKISKFLEFENHQDCIYYKKYFNTDNEGKTN